MPFHFHWYARTTHVYNNNMDLLPRPQLKHEQDTTVLNLHGGGGGGGAKYYVSARTSLTRIPKSLTTGVQGPLKGSGSSRGFDALSCAIWALFSSIPLQFFFFFFRGRLLRTPLNPLLNSG